MQTVITTAVQRRAAPAALSKTCGIVVAGVLAWWAQGCGKAGDQCIAGETELCEGPGGCRGARACQRNGAGFGACDCGDELALAPDAGTTSATRADVLAAPCESDADCGTNLRCWSSRDQELVGFRGGPARGYCTTTCSSFEECARFDPMATCGVTDPQLGGFCQRGCLSKEPARGEEKCLGREDLICLSVAAGGDLPFDPDERQLGSCVPSCSSDADCPGRFCDPISFNCSDSPASGGEIGAACDTDTDCAGGLCIFPVGGPAFCTAYCALYQVSACAWGNNASPRQAACKDPLVSNGMIGEGTGDLGLCRELCDTDSDCAQPGWFCIIGPGLPERAGFCDFKR
jgi:hypothetical protein